ncbi:MAG: hypothetical protein AAFP89_16700 [Bacteroidota bacterium]
MKYTITLITGLIGLMGISHAQDLDSCKWNISHLHTPLSVEEEEEIAVGQTLYLSQAYLHHLENSKYQTIPTGIIHYVYVRPASRKERKTRKVEGSHREVVGIDGNIYVPKIPISQQHFFQVTAAFEGDYHPFWEDPDLIIPIGLTPVDIRPYANEVFHIQEKTDTYLVLAVEGKTLVFYIGFPPIPDVFDSEILRQALNEKQASADQLIGKEWLAYLSFPPIYRSAIAETAPSSLFMTEGVQTYQIFHTQAQKEGVTFWVDSQQKASLADSILTLYDKGCVQGFKNQYIDNVSSALESENIRLSHILKTSTQDEDWIQSPWVRRTLFKRFWQRMDTTYGIEYKNVLIPEVEDEYVHLSARVTEDGKAWLKSHFYSAKGLIHTRVVLFEKGRRDSLESQRISTKDPRNTRTYTRKWVIEEINFDDAADQVLLERIARNPEKPFYVRFTAGGSFFRDAPLPLIFKEQIRDAWMLSKILKYEQVSSEMNAKASE